MNRFRTRGLPVLLALCIAFIGVQVAGVHLHLCLDGQEPPGSLHLSDAGLHSDHHDDDEHNDLDLTGLWGVQAKKSQSGFDLPTFIPAAPGIVASTVIQSVFHPADSPRDSVTGYRYYRPPLRAPPA
jgi:hypothetical protein